MIINYSRNAEDYDKRHGNILGRAVVKDIASGAGLIAGDTLLDFAAGTGRASIGFAEYGLKVTSVDVSEGMLEKLTSRSGDLPIQTVIMDGETLPFDDDSFDAVSAARVFYLIEDWQGILDEIKRVLKPGGVFLHDWGNGDPDEDWVRIRETLRHQLDSKGIESKFHPGVRSEAKLNGYLSQNGFSEITCISAGKGVAHTLRDFIDLIAQKTCSYLWDVKDDVCAEEVAALTQWASQEFQDLDKSFNLPRHCYWRVFRLTS
ncbi:MAG: class I SAM-dependent methyltransferase [Hellea sp.]